jgi:glutamyl-tRNA reductase
LDETLIRNLLNFIGNYTAARDVMVLSTCNRTEIYYSSEEDVASIIFTGLTAVKSAAKELQNCFEQLRGVTAVGHLFEVSLGLDSQVLGDLQIIGQIKKAYQRSADEEMAGPFLHRLMHTIFYTNKRVVNETSFRDGGSSVGHAVKELVDELSLEIQEPTILIVGAGEMGTDVCARLQKSAMGKITVLNRSIVKAHKLAEQYGYGVISFDKLPQAVAEADIIISSVSGEIPVIDRSVLQDDAEFISKFFIDISVPLSVDPALKEVPGVVIYTMDYIGEKNAHTAENKKASIPRVRAIMQEAMAEFFDWSASMMVSPVIQKLKESLEHIRKQELATYLKNANTDEVEKLEAMSRSLIQKILKYPVLQLKAACKRGEAENLSSIIQDFFSVRHQLDEVRK